MTRKVGIITCSKETNYGACLQSYATQIIISKLGYDVEILNYSFEEDKSYLFWKNKYLSTQIASILFYSLRKSIYYAFKSFHEGMPYSKEVYKNIADFRNATTKYDILLVGSDQVWNPNLGIDNDITLLKFYENGPKKISYASSFGLSSLPENQKARYAAALKEFDFISTREKQGQQIIYELIHKEVPIVLDPTMLLSAQDWENYQSEYRLPKEKYILIYDTQHSADMFEMSLRIAKEQRLKIYVLSRIKPRYSGMEVLYNISPADFLTLISHAEYVLTDSFHGTIYSINYHKEFYAFCPKSSSHLSSRITNILDVLNLRDRLIDENSTGTPLPINYEIVDLELKACRKKSLSYLESALKAGEYDNVD